MTLPVNLVTGFLGTGKTTLIRHLLQHHPPGQRWAVLVNEFGEVGIDGALLGDTGVAIEEIAGGCLCCVAAPAFTTGLNRLIRQHRPDRILIEPSGLGHPAQVLEQLRSPTYRDLLDVRATLCLIDPRHLASPRHRTHPTFQDQIHLADVLVANKTDLCSDDQTESFLDFAARLTPPKQAVLLTSRGRINPESLDLAAEPRPAAFPEAHAFLLAQGAPAPDNQEVETNAWLRYQGETEGYHRLGWRLGPGYRFPRAALLEWLATLPGERIKGQLLCTDGGLSYNRNGNDAPEIRSVDAPLLSRLQVIDRSRLDVDLLETALRDLAIRPSD